MPHIQYLAVNSQKIDHRRLNDPEREILAKWEDRGFLAYSDERVLITEDFWRIICELIYLGYVDIHLEKV